MFNEDFYKIVDDLALINEDENAPVKTAEEMTKEAEKENEPSEEISPRQVVREAIESQVDMARSMISTINDAFADDCGKSKKFANMDDQKKNWEKTMRGACQQVVSIVENKKFNYKDSKICSPMAYKRILNSDSRDLSVLDLCAAIIVFYNSLA